MSKKTRKNILTKIAKENEHQQLIKEAQATVSSGQADNLGEEILKRILDKVTSEIASEIIDDLDED